MHFWFQHHAGLYGWTVTSGSSQPPMGLAAESSNTSPVHLHVPMHQGFVRTSGSQPTQMENKLHSLCSKHPIADAFWHHEELSRIRKSKDEGGLKSGVTPNQSWQVAAGKTKGVKSMTILSYGSYQSISYVSLSVFYVFLGMEVGFETFALFSDTSNIYTQHTCS